jgi:tetratricopeptide (TPR) repeat protein
MTRSKKMAAKPLPAPAAARRPSRRALWAGALLLALAVAAVAGGLLWARQSPNGPTTDLTVDLTKLPATVRERIVTAQDGVARQPDSASAWGELGMVLDAHDFGPQAVDAYRQAETLAPAEGQWPYLRALVLRRSDRPAAIAAMEQALALGVDGLAAHYNFGALLLDASQTERAATEMGKALAIDAQSPFARIGSARVALAQNRPQDAATSLEAALIVDPTSVEAHVLLAQALRQLGRTAEADEQAQAARAYEQAERLGPADELYQQVVDRGASAGLLRRRAEVLFKAGQQAQAEELFTQAVAADPTDPGALVGLGIIRQAQGDLPGAIRRFEEAVAVRPNHVEAYNNLGWAKALSGDLPAAEKDLTRALELAPGHIEASLNLALVRLQQNRPKDAVMLAETVTKTAPGDVRSHNTLARALTAAGRAGDAEAAWRKSLALNAAQPEAWSAVAGAAVLQGDHAAAIEDVRQGLTTSPTSVDLMAILAWELATAPVPDLRRGEEARQLATTVAALRPALAQSHDILAAALAEAGDFEAAVISADKAIALLPANADAAVRSQIQERAELYRRRQAFHQAK